ncbi:AzlC family ABC transporter permease [Limosilactobacillus vaginalis]|jgi:4-azaleucine resistance transporter AzlC|uniref:AzlC family ABC transporter permease n=1 Tax=Limosilactobacillus vaginalis TaxID=1633 RepID=UPI002585AAA1|nr:AzlC family ABC transporter permease [Limosilactobacillus vaginalis]MDM8260441.1 AzlC family ABC transporter permease [Limosilactobacillus vaginalis]
MKKLDGEFRFALGKSMPVLLGYVTLGLGYGLYMHNLGFSFWYPTLMALTIYGGSVEFVIANMLVQHFNPLNVLLITLVVGFRQSFYALSMLKQYRHAGWRKWLLIFGLTDETFVINHYTKVPQEMSQVKVNTWITVLDWGYWVLGAFLGGFLGSVFQLQVKGLDFVMTALFIVLALDQFLQEKSHVSSISGVLITIISLLAVGKTYFLIVTLLLLVAEYYYLTRRHAKGDD